MESKLPPTNAQKFALLKNAKKLGGEGQRMATAIVVYCEQNPTATLQQAYRAVRMEKAIVMYRERWASGWTTEDIQIMTGFHRKDIHRELKRRGLSTSNEYEKRD